MIFGPTETSPHLAFRNRKTHAADARFVHQIDDQLQFMQALEIRHFRLKPLQPEFHSRPDQRAQTAAQNCLFAKKISSVSS